MADAMNQAKAGFEDRVEALSRKFRHLFGDEPRVYRAPGRVNLIGEHTDYNDGFVMPAAIGFYTWVGAAPRSDGKLLVRSENFEEQVEFDLNHLPEHASGHWSDYAVGVAKKLAGSGKTLPPASLLVEGDVPQGAGLSSSASFEVAIGYALLDLSGEKINNEQLALLCQRAENEFVGARCGIMDQFVSSTGRIDRALLLDCRSLEYRLLPIPGNVRLVTCNTMVKHSIAKGEYNQRRMECETGAAYFASKLPNVKALRDVTREDFSRFQAGLPENIKRRCRHVIEENSRVLEAGKALEAGDLGTFGTLMRESHRSLRDDFEVSCLELNLMVELGEKIDGVFGARMTGGGFGGCTINLVAEDRAEDFQRLISEEYQRATGIKPEIYVCSAAEGANRIL